VFDNSLYLPKKKKYSLGSVKLNHPLIILGAGQTNLLMKRILVDYKKLSHEAAAMLIDTYPDGYGDDDIISFRNLKGEFIEAVELRIGDTLYLVKISQSLSHFISNFDDTIEKELESKDDAHTEKEVLELNMEQEMDEESDLE